MSPLSTSSAPRVAYFTDCFFEVNGVARTSRHFTDFARRNLLPFLVVRGGSKTVLRRDRSVFAVQLERGRYSVRMERDFGVDPFLLPRFLGRVRRELRAFRPDLIHVTSPGDIGLMGRYLAVSLGIPLVAAWHTNVHEFARRRLERTLLHALPSAVASVPASLVERAARSALLAFYARARVIFAPNRELANWLGETLRRPTVIMKRGVDTHAFDPAKRDREDDVLELGYVGRLSPEKNVRSLARLERYLESVLDVPFRLVVVGEGSERGWLERNVSRARFTGVLRGEALARAYANFDVFVFPSVTDTFGNVVLEALASGVPAVVTGSGGPSHIVRDGETGLIGRSDEEFERAVARLAVSAELRRQMSDHARRDACSRSWDEIFETVYSGYEEHVREATGLIPAVA